MKEVQTVNEHCRHLDCKYRGKMTSLGFGQEWCMYCYITGHPRKCEISKCDKYSKGKLKRQNTKEGIRFYDDDIQGIC